MTLDSIREHCLSFAQTREQLQWGDSLLFKVAGKMFVIVSLNVERETRLSFKCTPESYAELVEREGITPTRYNMWKYHWVSLARLDTLPNHELKGLLHRSYELVAAKAIKKKRQKKSAAPVRTPSTKKHRPAKKTNETKRSSH
jgi:predicted DNA-binding protein (MmcQ/YjbR family)